MRSEGLRGLENALVRLLKSHPFYGHFLIGFRRRETADGTALGVTIANGTPVLCVNPARLADFSPEEQRALLEHLIKHVLHLHMARRKGRHLHKWDIACDLAINPLLVKDGLKPPPGTLLAEGFDGMTAEEIYPYVDENPEQETLDDHLYDSESDTGGGSGTGERSAEAQGRQTQEGREGAAGGAPPPRPLDAGEKERLAVQWRQRMAGAAQQAMMAGKLGGALARMVNHLLQPQLPWRMLLARYMTATARTDYSYTRPSRREGAAVLPSLRSSQIDLVVVLDTSGSIAGAEMDEFLSEVNSIKSQVNARVTLHACDVALADDGPWLYEPWEEFRLPREFRGGGGTSFRPVFEWLEREGRRPDLLVYFTDAQGEFPPQEPDYPVLWLVKGKAAVPWGQRIQLN